MTPVPRSPLFVPASRPDRFAKAAASEADGLMIDLEDAVAPEDKEQARANVVEYLSGDDRTKKPVTIRLNPLPTRNGIEDLAALAALDNGADFLMLPKAEEPALIAMAARILEDAGSASRLAALVESARGVARAAELAMADPRLAWLMFGAADYAADLGQQVGAFQPDFARATIVNAAAAGGVVAVDSPFFSIDDREALEAECRAARAGGFHGKAAIHPAQVDAIAQTFTPTPEERAQAARILEAAPDGVGVVDGKMVDIAMVRWAQRIA